MLSVNHTRLHNSNRTSSSKNYKIDLEKKDTGLKDVWFI
jgi:hypothetical protein